MMRRFDRRSLQVEIILNLACVMGTGLAVVAVVCLGLTVRTVERESIDRLRITARQFHRVGAAGTTRLADLAALLRTLDPSGGAGHWQVVDRQGRSVWRSAVPGVAPPPPELLEEAKAVGEAVRGGILARTDLRLAVPVSTARGETGILVGTVPLAEMRGRLRPVVGSVLWVLGITAVSFVGFGAYLLRRRIVSPVQSLAVASGRIAAGTLSTRVEIAGSSELEELGRHFNDMADSLDHQRRALIEAERTLARSERLASVGCLAAGVAHEVGNPVSAVLGFVEVGLSDPTLSPLSREALGRLRTEALRVRQLIRELLDLSRSDDVEPVELDPGELVRGLLERMRAAPSAGGVELRLEVGSDLPPVRTDPRRADQILVNLIENALQAAKPAVAGRVTVAVRHAPGQLGTPGRRRSDPEAADAVAIDVCDNGPGIPAESLGHVFDPFFTTKEPGSGTGLGLWNAHRLAELLGGRIEAESRPGATRFSLLIPVADTGAPDAGAASSDR